MNLAEFLFTDPAPVRAVLRRVIERLKLGSYRFRLGIGAVERPHYGYIIHEAARLAARLGHERISVVEFGVAGGNGLLAIERHAAEVEKLFPVRIEVYGFDTGEGLPEPVDYRDLPYLWQRGHFAMDHGALRQRLTRSKLVIGNVADTAKTFFQGFAPAPIGAVVHDFDFYSSTLDALELFRGEPGRLLPRVYCYFDDTMGDAEQVYSQFTGERLAIEDFNAGNEDRKIGIPFYLRARQALGAWVHQIWILHVFSHPDYTRFIASPEQQLPLR